LDQDPGGDPDDCASADSNHPGRIEYRSGRSRHSPRNWTGGFASSLILLLGRLVGSGFLTLRQRGGAVLISYAKVTFPGGNFDSAIHIPDLEFGEYTLGGGDPDVAAEADMDLEVEIDTPPCSNFSESPSY